MLRRVLFVLYALTAALSASMPALADTRSDDGAQEDNPFAELDGPPVSDDELAGMTGGFELPNGVELAMSVTSDTLVDGQLVLRTVLTVDDSAHVEVFGRQGAANSNVDQSQNVATTPPSSTSGVTGVTVMFDRNSGTQTVTPTFGVGTAVSVKVGGPVASPVPTGLTQLTLVAGGSAIATNDGLVTLVNTSHGVQVTLAGDQLGIAHLVGDNIATAIVNSANDRTIDTVTNVNIDLQNAAPFAMASAGLQIDSIARDVANGLVR